MIEAASKALEAKKIDSYTMSREGANVRVKITRGAKVGEAVDPDEEKALEAAIEATRPAAKKAADDA